VRTFDDLLASLTPESEIFGFLGRDYPHSFYKVYVRASPKAKWWRLKRSGSQSVQDDPIKAQATVPVNARTGVVWGPLAYVLMFDHHREYLALVRLHQRALELLGQPKQHVVSLDGPRSPA
jgi:hypothetical protein